MLTSGPPGRNKKKHCIKIVSFMFRSTTLYSSGGISALVSCYPLCGICRNDGQLEYIYKPFYNSSMIRSAIFDLGNTLIASSFPLSWQEYYSEAMTNVFSGIGHEATPKHIDIGKEILLKYNTRVNPRTHEISADTLFQELFDAWGITDFSKLEPAKEQFASFFLNRSVLYPDTIPMLLDLKKKRIRTGVLTNAAYGLGREYMALDIAQIQPYIDVVLTSVEVGFRKPDTRGFRQIAGLLQIKTGVCLFIGDEEVDVTGANNSGMISVLVDRAGSQADYGQRHTVSDLRGVVPLLDGQ